MADANFLSYELYELPNVKPYPGRGIFRGSKVCGKYVACLGSAHTFGRYVRRPYPAILAELLETNVLNLGVGGISPRFYSDNAALLNYVNEAAVTVIQVFSGRSQSNSEFARKGYCLQGIRKKDGKEMSSEQFLSAVIKEQPSRLPQIISETQANYVSEMVELLSLIRTPKILLWFSTRPPSEEQKFGPELSDVLGAFPHLVNAQMIKSLAAYCNSYVECVTSSGLPFEIVSMDGKKSKLVSYYPSPSMHETAATLLVGPCSKLLGCR